MRIVNLLLVLSFLILSLNAQNLKERVKNSEEVYSNQSQSINELVLKKSETKNYKWREGKVNLIDDSFRFAFLQNVWIYENGRLVKEFERDQDNQARQLYKYFYNENGDVIEKLSGWFAWDTGKQTANKKMTYVYGTDNLLAEVYTNFIENSEWISHFRDIYHYENELLKEKISQNNYSVNNEWTSQNRSVYIYDSNKFLIGEDFQSWNYQTNFWNNSRKVVYENDSNGNKIKIIEYSYSYPDSSLVNNTLTLRKYNEQNQMIEYEYSRWNNDSGAWEKWWHHLYNYDPDGEISLNSAKWYDLDNQKWVDWYETTFITGNDDKIVLINPFGNSQIKFNSSYWINWIGVGVEKVNIDFSKDNGNIYNRIAENILFDNGYEWTTPNQGLNDCKIKISDASNPLVFSENVNPFNISHFVPGEFIEVSSTSNSNVDITVQVLDPGALTGDEYEIHFGEQYYYLNENGEWVKTNSPDSIGTSLRKINDQSQSKILALPSIYEVGNSLNLYFKLENNAPDYNYIDGVRLTFPSEIQINSALESGDNHNEYPQIIGSTVTWGTDSKSGNGGFLGDEELIVNINYTEPTFSVDYEIFDDGWSESYFNNIGDSSYYKLGDGTVNGTGTVILNGELGYQFRSENYWTLFNKTKNQTVLDYETIIGGKDINTDEPAPSNYDSIVDGVKILLNGTFKEPIKFSNIYLDSPTGLSSITTAAGANTNKIAITNYTIFGVETSRALDNFEVGTSDILQLEQDYELRFNGVLDTNIVNGQTQITVKSGGSMATCFQFNSGFEAHPLNNAGLDAPFLVRIPFEVWNIENPNNPFQVNLTFRDRIQQADNNPFYAWNLINRMYGIIVNSDYNPNQVIQVDNGPDEFNAFATWVLVFYGTNYHMGDVVRIKYTNPIQLSDIYSFTTGFPTGINTINDIPNKFELSQNYPNPFNPETKINFSIPVEGRVQIKIYNILGQGVTELINENLKAGSYETTFTGTNLASGVYFYRIEILNAKNTINFVKTKKMILLK